MKKIAALSALSAFTLISLPANAGELQVKGTIRPSACTPTFANGGVVDYGMIEANELSIWGMATRLDSKSISLAVNCGAPTRIALRLVDNQASSVVPGLVEKMFGGYGVGDERAYGLGTVNGKKVGVYTVDIEINSFSGTQSADEGASYAHSITGHPDTGWAGGSIIYNYFFSSNGLDNWKAFQKTITGYGNPEAWLSLAGNLNVSTMIDQREHLPLEQEVNLNGSATLEIMYL